MKRFFVTALAVALLASVAQAQTYMPYNEPFTTIGGPPADGTPYTSASTGVIDSSLLPGWTMRSAGANAAINATRAARFYDTSSAASVTLGTAPTDANCMRATHNPTYSAEMLTNGAFTGDAAGWTLGAGWEYSSDSVSKTADGTETLIQATPLTVVVGSLYEVTFTLSNWTAGTLTANLGGANVGGNQAARGADGTYTAVVTATTTASLLLTPSSTGRFTVDNVSVKELTGSIAQGLVSPTITMKPDAAGALVRQYTARLKFAVLEKMVNNDIRFGPHFLPINANQNNYSLLLKIGQGEFGTMATKDMECFTQNLSSIPGNVPIPWGSSREDDTDYELNRWYTAEWIITTSATAGEGKATVRVDGKRFPRNWLLNTVTDAGAATTRLAFISFHNTDGSILFDDLEIVAGHPSYPEVQVMDGTTDVTAPTYDAVTGTNIPATVNAGSVMIGGPALEKTITINNIGSADLTTANLSVTGDFALKTGEALDASIAAAGTDTIVVEMASTTEGAKTGTLSFTSNDVDVTINLAGTVDPFTAARNWEHFE